MSQNEIEILNTKAMKLHNLYDGLDRKSIDKEFMYNKYTLTISSANSGNFFKYSITDEIGKNLLEGDTDQNDRVLPTAKSLFEGWTRYKHKYNPNELADAVRALKNEMCEEIKKVENSFEVFKIAFKIKNTEAEDANETPF